MKTSLTQCERTLMNTSTPTLTLAVIADDLAAPFPLELIELKPGATTQSKERCLAMAYADMRAYEWRLDEIAGVENWATSYQMTARGVVCALTICGVTKSGIGDYPTSADAVLDELVREGEITRGGAPARPQWTRVRRLS